MRDGQRHFAGLPETYDVEVPQWDRLRDHVVLLPGATLTGFVTDHVTEAWIDFAYRGYGFAANNQHGEWWLFVDDPSCPDEILGEVVDHLARLLGEREPG
jgi:hypothetical protein